jgi:hypothetical protein
MKNPNELPGYKKSIRTLAATSAMAIAAASGIGVGEASASQRKETPRRALTNLVQNLDRGGQVQVAANDIKLAGTVGTAEGKPIVFNSGGRTYLAFTQEQMPDFNQKRAADVVGDMTIVKEPSSDIGMPLQDAHLDKTGILVDENEMAVGYSIGGDTTGK